MNIPGTAGESSCKRQENGDVSTGSERPLKKARFAWQVKGKYHLKNDIPDTKTGATKESDVAGSSSDNISDSNLVGNTEQNLEILGDYLFKQDFNTLDSVIDDSENTLLEPSTSISTENLHYPRYVSSYDNNNSLNNTVSTSSSIDSNHQLVSMSMVFNNTEEQCIARWQARQVAKGFVDNTINRVLDSWMVAPLPTEMDENRFLALDVAEFINNLPGDNSIENEGILMAISAHGLQNTSNSSSESQRTEKNSSTKIENDIFLSPPSSPVSCGDLDGRDSMTNIKPINSDGSPSNELDMSWSYDLKRDDNNEFAPFSFSPDTSSSPYPCFNEHDHLPSAPSNYYNELISSNNNDIVTSHYDFLDAAVSFAIQNKGLTSLGTDYG